MHGHFVNNSGRKNMAVLWNMSIRKSVGVVVPGLFDSPFVVSLGFGVCPVSNDPMIIKFTYVDPYLQWQNKVVIDRFIYWVAYDDLTTDGEGQAQTLGFRKNGELISEYRAKEDIIHERQAGLVAYEPWSELINDLLLYGSMYSFFVSSYVETLVLLDQVDCSILETFS
ncbi:hypothetical protein Tco_1111875 [Tanacetum coccineum]|uniref:Uncharacterized protein n=1 Tax=Tanacetum coccineum TaxID=301880 RepID=A0ABQ5IN07_9ASTR